MCIVCVDVLLRVKGGGENVACGSYVDVPVVEVKPASQLLACALYALSYSCKKDRERKGGGKEGRGIVLVKGE